MQYRPCRIAMRMPGQWRTATPGLPLCAHWHPTVAEAWACGLSIASTYFYPSIDAAPFEWGVINQSEVWEWNRIDDIKTTEELPSPSPEAIEWLHNPAA